MLTIRLCEQKAPCAAACKEAGQVYSEAFYLYVAENRGETLATALFEIKSSEVLVISYNGPGEDAFLFDGMMRAGLNYAGGQGLETGVIPEQFRHQHRALFAKLNYPAVPSFNIVNFFQKYKSCNL